MKTFLQVSILILAVLMIACNDNISNKAKNGPVKVELKKIQDGSYQLFCDGKPFYIKGAGLGGDNIKSLVENGGNTIRTWSTGTSSLEGNQMLDQAAANGLKVVMGLDVARERHGFDYNDTVAVKNQLERLSQEVLIYKDHPAMLAWGIGNELNLHYTNPGVWNAVNDIAAMIHKLDPNHPTTTMFAGAGKTEIDYVKERCPEIDFLSFQIYGDIKNLPDYIAKAGYEGAYTITEWGTVGHWEVEKTEWGRPIELTSSERAHLVTEWYQGVIAAQSKQCIGSFVFLWGQKQERTPTWYGLFTEDGCAMESVDAMFYNWNGKWPENRAPQILHFFLNDQNAYQNIKLLPGEKCTAKAEVTDPNTDPIDYTFEILTEVPENQQSLGGDYEKRPVSILKHNTADGVNTLEFVAPSHEGQYRIFVYAGDGKNKVATANIPFLVTSR